jgi:hypothetical protein
VTDTWLVVLLLFGGPALLGLVVWLLVLLESGEPENPGRTPFDPPPW